MADTVQRVDYFYVQVPNKPGVQLHDILTVNLSAGTIDHVVNDTGGSSTIANPDVPVAVVSYP